MGVAAVPMSLNGYSYVHNNPVNWTDPSGEFLPVIAVIGLGILGGAVGGALLGGGIEAGSQLLNNGFDLGCLDMDSVGRAALEGAALGALAGGVGAAVGAAGLSGAAAFAISEGADFIGGFLYDIGVNGLSREQAIINGLAGIGFGGAIGLLGRGLSRAARNINLPNNLRRQCASFSADTLIATPEGDKPISEIEVGDVILAYSEATEEVDIYHVSATHTQHHETTLDVAIDGETLHTTDEHPFYVIRDDQEQWVQAKHLQADDRVLAADGTLGVVEAIEIVDKPQTMYNLTVALVATYLVGDGQWVVHNQSRESLLQLEKQILSGSFRRYRLPSGLWLVRYGSRKGLWRALHPLTGQQANHLNQSAAFPMIKRREGLTVYLEGQAQVSGTAHNRFHRSLDDFWSHFRLLGAYVGGDPTINQYDTALYNALLDAEIDTRDAELLSEVARIERLRFGIEDNDYVPNLPGKVVGNTNSNTTRNSICP